MTDLLNGSPEIQAEVAAYYVTSSISELKPLVEHLKPIEIIFLTQAHNDLGRILERLKQRREAA